MNDVRHCDIPRMKRPALVEYARGLRSELEGARDDRRQLLELRARIEELVEERDDAVSAWEDCCTTVSELRAERNDAIDENRRLRDRVRALEDMIDRYAK